MTLNGLSIETEKSKISSDMNFSYATIYGFKIFYKILLSILTLMSAKCMSVSHFARGLEKILSYIKIRMKLLTYQENFPEGSTTLSGKDVHPDGKVL